MRYLNPNRPLPASHCQRMKMKTALLICISTLALCLCAFGQDPTASPSATSSAFTVTTSIAPTAVPSPTAKDDLESRIDRKVKKGLSITFGDHDDRDRDHDKKDRVRVHDSDSEDLNGWMAVPIVAVIFTTLFGAPVLVVAAIMFFSYL